jgi:two-component system sensor histidine kinase DctS
MQGRSLRTAGDPGHSNWPAASANFIYSEPFFLERQRAFVALSSRSIANASSPACWPQPIRSIPAGQPGPWWFTEKIQVEIVDDNDIRYAAKTNIEGNSQYLRHVIPFDPPGAGCCCASPATERRTTLCNAAGGRHFPPGAGVFWSLWLVRDLMKKRSHAEEALRAEHAFARPWRTR